MLEGMRERLDMIGRPAMERLSLVWTAVTARARAALAPRYAAAYARYQKLEARERVLVQVLAAVMAVFLAYNLVYVPVRGAFGGLAARIEQRQHDAVEVARMMRTYQRLRIDLATMRKRTVSASGDFSLFSVVEQALTKAPGKDKIASITPADKKIPGGLSQYTVELKLNNLSLGQIVDTLYGLGALNVPVTVSSLHVTRRTQDPHTFDVEMTCVALGRNG